jgi:hypothetical protein
MNFWRALLISIFLAAAANIGHADTVLSTTTCSYKGSSQNYTVPAGTDYITVKAWGGGGGCGNNSPGGDGTCVIASYNVTPGQTCTINVGGGGSSTYGNGSSSCGGGWPDGGSCQRSNCGAGGGSTTVTTPSGSVQCAGGCGGDNNGGWGCPGGFNGSPPSGYSWNNNSLSGCGGGSASCGGSFFNGSVTCGGNGHPACTSDPNYPGNNCSSGGVCGQRSNAGCSGGCVIVACQRLHPPVITSPLTASGKLNESFYYTITATNNPTSYGATSLPAGLSVTASTGVISGAPTVAGTFSVTISATNAAGTGSATLVLTVSQTYNLSITASPSAGGTFAGSGTYDPGTLVQIAEVASLNYRTNGWGGADGSHTAAPANAATSIIMSANRTLVAQFVPQGKLVVTAGPGGSATGGGVFDNGTSAPIAATAGSGYAFKNWTGAGIANPNVASTTVSISGNETVTANFVSAPPPVFTSGNTPQTLPVGQTYTFTNTATNSPTFSGSNLPPGLSIGTSGTITGSPTTPGTWTATIVATNPGGTAQQNIPFTVLQPPVITSPLTASGKLNEPFSYLITATNNPTSFGATNLPSGLTVSTSTGSISGTPTVTGTFHVTISASNAAGTGSATLVLTVTQTYTLAITGSPSAGGIFSGAGSYDPGTVVSISEVANSGYRASGWGGLDGPATGNPNSASTTIVMSSNRTLVAEFVAQATLTVIANSGGAATGGGTFDLGSSPTITATPTGGNLFVNWTGATVNNSFAPATTIHLTANQTVTANFALVITSPLTAGGKLNEPFTYTITATGSPNVFNATNLPPGLSVNQSTGVISGMPTVTGPYTVPISAANGNASGSATLIITVTQTYTLVITGSPANGGTFAGAGTYDPGTIVQIAEVAGLNYRTNGWGGPDGGNTAAPANAATSIQMTANRTLVAEFVPQGKLVVIAGPGGSATGGGVYDTGTNAAITATPNSGSVFTGWSGSGIANTNAADTTVAISGNETVTANFVSGTPEQLGTITFPDAVPPGLPGETPTTSTMPAVFVNSGSKPEVITDITTTGDFQPAATLPITLAPGASASVIVTFSPTALGLRTGVLTAVSNSSVNPLAQFTLQGTGVNPSDPPTATISAPATAFSLSPLTVTSSALAPNDNLTLHSIEWLSPSGSWTVSSVAVSGGVSDRSLGITFPTSGIWTVRAGASVDGGLTWVYSPSVQINVSPGIVSDTLESMAVPGSNSAQVWYTPSPVVQQTYQVQYLNQ